jgi:hydrogenase maturation protein HypF
LAARIRSGEIAAVKGIGGFHLLCDATNEAVVIRLRERKGRSAKPFAVMFKDSLQLCQYTDPTESELTVMRSAARPIVLVRKRPNLPDALSPGLKSLGAFLPYSPLHRILLEKIDLPVVATSGNLSEEPVVKENEEALERLSPIVDTLLLHNRPIHRRCDDSVVKVSESGTEMIRRSRGYVPVPVVLPFKLNRRVLAVGGHQKNTVAIGFDDKIILSQHIGDMETPESLAFFEEAIRDLSTIYRFTPDVVIHDLHPRYESTRWARNQGCRTVGLQHHYAHVLSCMAENGLQDRVLGVAWDGTGYGEDGTLWGGEFLRCSLQGYERFCHFRPLKLIGGERAIREPRRVALAIVFELFGKEALGMSLPCTAGFSGKELEVLWRIWQSGLNAPETTSAGRLFDGVASLIDLIQVCSYEAQAAMMVEDLFDPRYDEHYSYRIEKGQVDWRPMFRDVINDRHRSAVPSRFINTLGRITGEVALQAGEGNICLSGGVFQNSPLRSSAVRELKRRGFEVYLHGTVPSNDGGLSLGQALYGGMG